MNSYLEKVKIYLYERINAYWAFIKILLLFPFTLIWFMNLEIFFQVALANPVLWAIFIITFGYPIYRKFKNHVEYTWGEFLFHFYLFTIYLVTIFTIFFAKTTDLLNENTINTKVAQVLYDEQWTEQYQKKVCKGSRRRSCHYETATTIHPAQYYLRLADSKEIDIERDIYLYYTALFENSVKEELHHSGQISTGDGNRYRSYANDYLIPASYKSKYVDYIKANGGTILKESFTKSYPNYQSKLVNYPQLREEGFGPIGIDRIIDPLNVLEPDSKKELEESLDRLNALYGKSKEVNIILYVVQEVKKDFPYALSMHWKGIKQNDVLIIVSLDQSKKIQWCKTLAFTEHELFKRELENAIVHNGEVNLTIADIIKKQIQNSPSSKNGFLKTQMEKYSYLKYQLSMPWEINIGIFIFFMISNILATRFFEKNKFSLLKDIDEDFPIENRTL
ncbi:hypothetical protein [Sulfuricurvum sp.]|uniref:hypothetical protein n=1 Tax=Sulfuricurvum sp. TaxID=2025608 RepID=UPI002E338A3D|nr:hypothetical protein [Sulfuricurvum sp.]HEX5330047.1 hypothetical protein [Sulfuricurvum sp.]